MSNLKIISTSSTLPNHFNWRILKNSYSRIEFGEYGGWIQDLSKVNNDTSVLILLSYQDLFPSDNEELHQNKILEIIINVLHNHLKKSNQDTFFIYSNSIKGGLLQKLREPLPGYTFEVELFKILDDITSKYNNFYKFNLNLFFDDISIKDLYDIRNWYVFRSHLSSLAIKKIANTLVEVSRLKSIAPKKVLVLDCDNTLWGGVIGEDGLRNIKLGQDGIGSAYLNFQKKIKSVQSKGILLALTSKNIETDVMEVLINHEFMLLRIDDIVSWRINWLEKSQNIQDIANELDLGLDSFVFWDDNPVEREKVKRNLPNVMVVEPPVDVELWPDYLQSLDELYKFKVTEDDLNKNKQYKIRADFVRAKSTALDELEYLKSIDLSPEILPIGVGNISRAAQLCLKTNQFNVSLRRHSEDDLYSFLKYPDSYIYLVKLKDIYGDHGIVSMFCAVRLDEQILFVDTFLMSCRVLGRHLESWVLSYLIRIANQKELKYLLIEYVETNRNKMSEEFLLRSGFAKVSLNGELIKKIPHLENNDYGIFYQARIDSILTPYMEAYKNDCR